MVKRNERQKDGRISRNPLFLVFFLGLFALPAHASTPNACVYDKLKARLGKTYDEDDLAQLPARISIHFGEENPESLFKIFLKIWQEGEGDFLAEKAMLKKIAKRQPPSREEIASLKFTRARFKQLRFAFSSFDKKHEYPPVLDQFTVAMGKIQDALAADASDTAAKLAKEILKKWDQSSLRKIEAEVDHFKPASKKSFYRWIAAQLDELESLLDKKTLSPRELHEARKVLARQNAVFFVLDAAVPTPETNATLNYLSAWNAKVGDFHDDLITQELNGTLDEKNAEVVFPKALKMSASDYIQKMRAFLKEKDL